MTLTEIWDTFIQNIRETKWPEWVSTLTQIASVWYARKNNVLVYPTGIIGVLLAAYVYFFMVSPPLYAGAKSCGFACSPGSGNIASTTSAFVLQKIIP